MAFVRLKDLTGVTVFFLPMRGGEDMGRELTDDEMSAISKWLVHASDELNFYKVSRENARTEERTEQLRKLYDVFVEMYVKER